MKTVLYAGPPTDQRQPFRFHTVAQETGGTLIVQPPTAPAGSAASVSARRPGRPVGIPARPAAGDRGLPGRDRR